MTNFVAQVFYIFRYFCTIIKNCPSSTSRRKGHISSMCIAEFPFQGYSHIWTVWGCATKQGVVLAVLNLLCHIITFYSNLEQGIYNLNQKLTRHFFKLQIRIKFLARHSGEKKVIFQSFCSPEAKSSRHWRLGKRYLNPW